MSYPAGPEGEFGGPSLAGASNGNAKQWFSALLADSNRARIDAITFHDYASCRDPTAAGLEPIFPSTVAQLSALQEIQALRDELRPETSIHLTESGIICNSPRNCSGNDYSCYYTTADFTRTYWVASAAQWLYQFLLSSRTADLATVAQSQILGYPAGTKYCRCW